MAVIDLGDIIGGSKSEKILLIILGLISVFGVVAIVVYVAFGDNVIDLLIAIYGALGLNGAGSLIRNIAVDGPIRKQAAVVATAQAAKESEIEIPIVMNTQSSAGVGGTSGFVVRNGDPTNGNPTH